MENPLTAYENDPGTRSCVRQRAPGSFLQNKEDEELR